MKLSRNALRNLANRYRAVLKKCRLVNTFGSLAVAAMLVMGVGENVLAYGPGEASDKNITYNSTSGPLPDIVYGGEATGDWGNGAVDASRNSLIIEGRNDDVNGIYGGKADTRYPDSAKRSQALNNNVSIKQSTITVKGNKIGFDQGEIDISVIGGYAGKEANNNSVNIDSGTFSGVVIGGMATGKNGKAVGNSVNLSGGILTGGAFNDEQIAVVGGYANAGSLQNNTVQISGTAKVTGNVYAIYCQSSPDKAATTISGEVIITEQEEHSSPDLSQSSLYGYNKTHPLYGMKDRIDLVAKIENFDGTIKNIGQFTTVTVTGSTLKVENVDCAVETSYGSFERSVFTGNNSNITITGSIKNFNEFKIDNTKDNTVEIHSIKGFSKSIANIQSGTVILHNGISTPYQGKFTINDAEGSASFTTQITGNLSNEQEGSISASFNTKESFLTGTADKGTGTTTLAFANGARWNMTGNSTLSGLNLNGSGTVDGEGTVDLTSGRTGSATNARTLTLDTLDGDGGTFVVDTNINNDTDRIVINGEASGDHKLDVKASGGEPSQAAMNNFIVRQNGGTASFSLANPGGKVDAGLYLYELASRDLGSTGNPDGREWYLQRSAGGEKSPTGETVLGLSGMASAYAMYMGQLSDLRERLGEIRHGNGKDGLWVRGFTEENRLSGLAGIDFSQNFYGTSFGYDRLVEQNENNKWLFGVRGQLTKADQRIDGLHDGSGDSRSYGLAAYATWQHGDGWYADTVLSWDWYDQNLKTRMLDGTRVHGSYNTYAGGISQEFGRLFRFGEGFFIEPQLQLSWYWMKGTDFTTSNGMKVEQDDAYALTGRAGLVLGKKWDLDEGRYFQPYIKGGVNHEFAGDQKVTVNDIAFSDDLRGTRIYYGAGFDVQFASNARFYAEFEREDGNKASTPWSVSAGLRVEF